MARWILAVLVAVGSTCEARAEGPPAAAPAPVLVELFTSEGCSSCPPADAELARLDARQPIPGALVVPLAHHVDYWDSLGWPDPFARAEATKRQRWYGGNYTPQAIVDGGEEMVGSRGAALEAAIARAARRPHVAVAIAVAEGGEVTVSAPEVPGARAFVALVQTHARVSVPRGENAGRTLDHTAVVRALEAGRRVRFTPPKGVARADLRVVAFVQDEASRRVLGSASAPFGAAK